MSWLSYAAPTIIEQAKVVGLLSAMLWLFQTVLLHSEVHKPDQARHTHARTHAHLQPSGARWLLRARPASSVHSLRLPLTAGLHLSTAPPATASLATAAAAAAATAATVATAAAAAAAAALLVAPVVQRQQLAHALRL